MAKKCAYCKQEKTLTKEHVWPSCFLDRVGRGAAHYSPKSGKVHGSDYIVKDVCSDCNNDYLSGLDSYFCCFYDTYLSVPLGAHETVEISYDYDLLSRALLKIAFNTARNAGSATVTFQRLLAYILRGDNRPSGIAIIVELVSPSYVWGQNGLVEIRPTMYRSARCEFLAPHGNAVLVRMIAVNSFMFHLLIAKNPDELNLFDQAVTEFLTGIDGSVLLNTDGKKTILKSTHRDSLRSMIPLLTAKHGQYSDYFNRKREGSKNKQ